MDDLIRRQDALKVSSMDSGIYIGINNLPSVDAVEVVRCEDCKHWKHGNIRPNYCEVFDWSNEESDFCSFGERKTDG